MKKKSGKKISIFYFLIVMILTSVILIIYISNIIYVNKLSISNNEIKEEIKKNLQINNMLRTESEKLSSYERIKTLASEKFNLAYRENSIEEGNTIIIKKSQLK
ncbi:MAG: cell division protein FtsL [Ignavibacteria bacterium]|jgi:cell division protein FtsL|nr:cell division protein FtsL [Ignavibacteria bacterium]MBK6771414.1 cell division protein FtsL [Ignavibacteria bacterium]MBK7159426.1 cell division protein FtsL [Ignavibacteria bacterium]MBK7446345.1 cell division protein FtsL [Ignavibacteria bacterium]MBK8381582.1 cell division protein FtsL [Ignavibacteria bacterium]